MRRMFIAALMAASLFICGCTTNSNEVRYQLKRESEDNYGVMRTVTAYSSTGEQIGQWHGKIDVKYTNSETAMERVDIVVFDGEAPIDRIIISGATVIVDND